MPHATAVKNPIGHRLKAEMKKRGMSSTELARRSDVKTSFIYDIISGKSTNPSTVKLARVAEHLGISLNHLVKGTAGSAAVSEDYVSIPRVMVDVSAGGGAIVTSELTGESYSFRANWIREHLGVSPDDLRMLYISGDSMEPTLCNNDIILVDTTKKLPSPPGIFVLFDGMGLVAKRLEYITHEQPPRLRIVSDNPQYSTYERGVDEASIIGRVVWFAREM